MRRFAGTLLARVKKQGKPLGVVTRGGLILTPGEIERAGKLWVKQAQEERFPEEMKDLIGGKEVKRQSHLKPITPIVDELGVLRVRGRLDRAELPYDAAHPMILPKKHHITQLIVADVHNRCGGQSRAGSGANSILGHRWSARGKELGQRMQGV